MIIANAYPAEIVSEAGLEKGARRFVQRLPGRAQNIIYAGRGLTEAGRGRGNVLSLNLFFFLFAGLALSAYPRRRGGSGYPDHRGGHAHHLVSDSVRLLLQRVIQLSDGELCLNDPSQGRLCGRGGRFSSPCSVSRKDRDRAEIP
jgi:hypothetical protein